MFRTRTERVREAAHTVTESVRRLEEAHRWLEGYRPDLAEAGLLPYVMREAVLMQGHLTPEAWCTWLRANADAVIARASQSFALSTLQVSPVEVVS